MENNKRCVDCGGEITACGEMTDDGPSDDCLVCKLQSDVVFLQSELRLRVDYAGKFRELELNNRQLLSEQEALQSRVDRLMSRGIEDMKHEIEILRAGYDASGFEGPACPGCVYEDGKFIRRCRLHNRINNLEMTVRVIKK